MIYATVTFLYSSLIKKMYKCIFPVHQAHHYSREAAGTESGYGRQSLIYSLISLIYTKSTIVWRYRQKFSKLSNPRIWNCTFFQEAWCKLTLSTLSLHRMQSVTLFRMFTCISYQLSTHMMSVSVITLLGQLLAVTIIVSVLKKLFFIKYCSPSTESVTLLFEYDTGL